MYALRLRVDLELMNFDSWAKWWNSLPVRMRRDRGRHRFTLIGRKFPPQAGCMNIHEGGICLASVGLACLVSLACSRDARAHCT